MAENIDEKKYLIEDISSVRDGNFSELQTMIIKFVCWFSVFESFLYEKDIKHWYNFPKQYTVKDEYLTKAFNFFRLRYIGSENLPIKQIDVKQVKEGNIRLEDLCKNVETAHFKKKLKNNLISKKNKLETLLMISYYFRNNLYHGHKNIDGLEQYQSCFAYIVAFFITVLENAEEKVANR